MTFDDWIGRTEIATDTITPAMVEAYAATLGTTADATPGAAPPQGAHWLLAPPRAAMGELGADGHPQRGGFLPPIDLPRRMWAGSEVAFLAPLVIGEAIERISTVTAIEDKQGTSGPLVFVTVEHVHRVGGVAKDDKSNWDNAGRSHVIYSDDHGATWKLGGAAAFGTNECAVIERKDGSLLLNSRSYRGKACRAVSVSTDGGATWQPTTDEPVLVESVCQASMIRGKNGAVLFCNPATSRGRPSWSCTEK